MAHALSDGAALKGYAMNRRTMTIVALILIGALLYLLVSGNIS